jgi:type III pantothenate kinase
MPDANLVIDAGNTRVKVAVFTNRKVESVQVFDKIDGEVLSRITSENRISNAILSTVREDVGEVERFLQENFKYIRFNHEKAIGVKNRYKSKSTLGLDRLAAVTGAKSLYPKDDCLVIDSGTCITYDFIGSDANYYGGSISPGINMRFKAMSTFTDKLPLVEQDLNFNESFGRDTREALLSGVQNGMVYEVEGFIGRYKSKYPYLKILLCGGDCGFFDRRLKNTIFAPAISSVPELVLIGLNEIIHSHTND